MCAWDRLNSSVCICGVCEPDISPIIIGFGLDSFSGETSAESSIRVEDGLDMVFSGCTERESHCEASLSVGGVGSWIGDIDFNGAVGFWEGASGFVSMGGPKVDKDSSGANALSCVGP